MFEISVVVGNLTADAESFSCRNGNTGFNIRVASDRYDHQAGKNMPEFHQAKYFAGEKYAAVLLKLLKKGALVCVVGQRATEEWEDPNDGSVRRRQVIVADQLKVIVEAKPAAREDRHETGQPSRREEPQRHEDPPRFGEPSAQHTPPPQHSAPPVDSRSFFGTSDFK